MFTMMRYVVYTIIGESLLWVAKELASIGAWFIVGTVKFRGGPFDGMTVTVDKRIKCEQQIKIPRFDNDLKYSDKYIFKHGGYEYAGKERNAL